MNEVDDPYAAEEACWPSLSTAICRAREQGGPLAKGNLIWALDESLAWQAAIYIICIYIYIYIHDVCIYIYI